LFAGLDEFCQWETFRAECKADEVVIVKRAIYGRMQYGRCIKRDYGYVGCYADVMQLADSRCSGRQSCEIAIPDKLFDGTAPCPEDLKLYLMAEYICIKGPTIENLLKLFSSLIFACILLVKACRMCIAD
jgi:Galactose binding lectin domain